MITINRQDIQTIMNGLQPQSRTHNEQRRVYFAPKDGAQPYQIQSAIEALEKVVQQIMGKPDQTVSDKKSYVEAVQMMGQPEMYRGLNAEAVEVFDEIADFVTDEQVLADAEKIKQAFDLRMVEIGGQERAAFYKRNRQVPDEAIETAIQSLNYHFSGQVYDPQNLGIQTALNRENPYLIPAGYTQAATQMMSLTAGSYEIASRLPEKEAEPEIIEVQPVQETLTSEEQVQDTSSNSLLEITPILSVAEDIAERYTPDEQYAVAQTLAEVLPPRDKILNLNGIRVNRSFTPIQLVNLNEGAEDEIVDVPTQVVSETKEKTGDEITPTTQNQNAQTAESLVSEADFHKMMNIIDNNIKASGSHETVANSSSMPLINMIDYTALKANGVDIRDFDNMHEIQARAAITKAIGDLPDDKKINVQKNIDTISKAIWTITPPSKLVTIYNDLDRNGMTQRMQSVKKHFDEMLSDYVEGRAVIDQDNIAQLYDGMKEITDIYLSENSLVFGENMIASSHTPEDEVALAADTLLDKTMREYDQENGLLNLTRDSNTELVNRFNQVEELLKDTEIMPSFSQHLQFMDDNKNILPQDNANCEQAMLASVVKSTLLNEIVLGNDPIDESLRPTLQNRVSELYEIHTRNLIEKQLENDGINPTEKEEKLNTIIDGLKAGQPYAIHRDLMLGFTKAHVDKEMGLISRLGKKVGNDAEITHKMYEPIKNIDAQANTRFRTEQKNTSFWGRCLRKFGMGALGGSVAAGAAIGAAAVAAPTGLVVGGAMALFAGAQMWWQRRQEVKKAKEENRPIPSFKDFIKRNWKSAALTATSLTAIGMGIPAVGFAIGAVAGVKGAKASFDRHRQTGYGKAASLGRSLIEGYAGLAGSILAGSSIHNMNTVNTNIQPEITQTPQEPAIQLEAETPTDATVTTGETAPADDTAPSEQTEQTTEQSETVSVSTNRMPIDIFETENTPDTEDITLTQTNIQEPTTVNPYAPQTQAFDINTNDPITLSATEVAAHEDIMRVDNETQTLSQETAEDLLAQRAQKIEEDPFGFMWQEAAKAGIHEKPDIEYWEWHNDYLDRNPEVRAAMEAFKTRGGLFPPEDGDTLASYTDEEIQEGGEENTEEVIQEGIQEGIEENTEQISQQPQEKTLEENVNTTSPMINVTTTHHTYDTATHELAEARLNGVGVYNAYGRPTTLDFTSDQLSGALETIRSLEATHPEFTGANGESNAEILMYKLNQLSLLIGEETRLNIDGNRIAAEEAFGVKLENGDTYSPHDLRNDLIAGRPLPINSEQTAEILGKVETVITNKGHFNQDISGFNENGKWSFKVGRDAGFTVDTVTSEIINPNYIEPRPIETAQVEPPKVDIEIIKADPVVQLMENEPIQVETIDIEPQPEQPIVDTSDLGKAPITANPFVPYTPYEGTKSGTVRLNNITGGLPKRATPQQPVPTKQDTQSDALVPNTPKDNTPQPITPKNPTQNVEFSVNFGGNKDVDHVGKNTFTFNASAPKPSITKTGGLTKLFRDLSKNGNTNAPSLPVQPQVQDKAKELPAVQHEQTQNTALVPTMPKIGEPVQIGTDAKGNPIKGTVAAQINASLKKLNKANNQYAIVAMKDGKPYTIGKTYTEGDIKNPNNSKYITNPSETIETINQAIAQGNVTVNIVNGINTKRSTSLIMIGDKVLGDTRGGGQLLRNNPFNPVKAVKPYDIFKSNPIKDTDKSSIIEAEVINSEIIEKQPDKPNDESAGIGKLPNSMLDRLSRGH